MHVTAGYEQRVGDTLLSSAYMTMWWQLFLPTCVGAEYTTLRDTRDGDDGFEV